MRKIIKYSTPKALQPYREFSKWFKKNKHCKATKGEHNFILVESVRGNRFFNYDLYKCLCGKKRYQFIQVCL